MSDRHIQLDDVSKIHNAKISYIADDSSDNGNEGNDNLQDIEMLINNKKINKYYNDDDTSEMDDNKNFNEPNLDTVKPAKLSEKSSSSDRNNRAGKPQTLLESDSSVKQYTTRGEGSYNRTQLNYEDMMKRKHNVLLDINKFKDRGYIFMKDYNMSSNLNEMEVDLDRIKAAYNNKKGIKWCRDGLMFCCNGLEMLSGFTNFGNLDGWSESVKDDIENYDDVFEELYQKYGAYTDLMGPELKLVFMVISSAFLYHMMNSSIGGGSGGGGSGGIGGLIGGLMGGNGGGGLGNFMNFASNLGGNSGNNEDHININMNDNFNNNIPMQQPVITKTPIVQTNQVIKEPELAGLETLLDDLSNTSNKSTARRTGRNGKKILTLN